jgi:nicotinate-nucleotide adenylyltransferase
MKVAVFGGSFNPPHVAHVLGCALVLAIEDVDRVLVVPAYQHPFAKALAPFEDRAAMCELAMGGMPQVEVSRLEAELGGESRTLRTLSHLAHAHPDWSMRLVIGGDILAEAPRWYGFDAIEKIAPPIVLGRACASGLPGPANVGAAPSAGPSLLPAVSSTQVRDAIARGDWDEAARIVPRKVLAYVRAKGLYAATA